MKIALIGYGKMGKTIEKLALKDGHEIILKINRTNIDELTLKIYAKLMWPLNSLHHKL
jgi:4-hydroxy-tetrahydrodipicolinate reductase